MANILPPEVKAISDPNAILIFNKKPFKQLGKIALGSLIALTSGGSILAIGAV
jgi:hypothetical protein